ncbi:MAG TPA: DUF4389 domain-containing protein [Acidimicrobiales bacterium]|nr:DUF4389 domain-containing protein [Acidimicrobiales bacterium]
MPDTYPVHLDVVSPERVARWRPLVNWLLVIPVHLWLFLLLIATEVVVVLSWFAIVVAGRQPESFGAFTTGVIRYTWRTTAFLYALEERYPGFTVPTGFTDPGDFPAVVNVVPELKRNRLTVFFRAFMLIPHYVVLYFLGIVSFVVLVLAWFAVLFTGRWPEGFRRFYVGYSRWFTRYLAYAFLVVDAYPPFSFDP